MAAPPIPPTRLGLIGTLNRVLTRGAIGSYPASYPEFSVPPGSDATPLRALGSAQRTAVLAPDPVPGSTGLFDGLPGQHISSSASFAT